MLFPQIWGADSGDLVTAIYTRGSIHPPGYPIYYLLGQVFRFIPWGSPAQKISLISCLFSLGALLVLAKLLRYLAIKLVPNLAPREKSLILLVTLILIGSSYLYLLYSLVPEVFTTSVFLITMNLYFLVHYLIDRKVQDHRWFLFTLFMGLLFQYLILVNAVVYLISLRKEWRSLIGFYRAELGRLVSYLLVALLPYLLFYIVWNDKAIIFWEEKSLLGLWKLVTRAEYGFLSTSVNSYQNFMSKLENLRFYLLLMNQNFTLVGGFLAGLGMYQLFRIKKKIFELILMLYLLYGPLLFLYFDAKIEDNFSKAVLERFALFSFPYVAVFIYFGVLSLCINTPVLLKRLLTSNTLQKFTYRVLIALILVAYPLLLITKNLQFIMVLSRNNYFSVHADNLLENLPKGSIVLLSDDLYLFPSQYQRYVLNQRPDLALIAQSRMRKSGYAKVLKQQFGFLKMPKAKDKSPLSTFLKSNLKERRIFTNLKFESRSFQLDRWGLLYEVRLKSLKSKVNTQPNLRTEFLTIGQYSYPVYFYKSLQDIYSRYFYELGLTQKESGMIKRATNTLRTAYKIRSDDHDQNVLYALLLFRSKQCSRSREVLHLDFLRKPTHETALILSRLEAVCFKNAVAYEYWNDKANSLKPKE